MLDDGHYFHLANALPDDSRDVKSFYVLSSGDVPTALVFIFDVESDGLLLQAVDDVAHPPPAGQGMCASTLHFYANVFILPCSRCMLHSSAACAICTGFLAPRPRVNMDAMNDFISSLTVACFLRWPMLQSKPHCKLHAAMVMQRFRAYSILHVDIVRDMCWDVVTKE